MDDRSASMHAIQDDPINRSSRSRQSLQRGFRPQLPVPETERIEQFVAILSHELRSSLHAVNNALRLLRIQASKNPDENYARLLIHRQVARMTRLVEDLAEVSRLRNGKLRLQCERIDLRVVVKRAIETVSANIEQRHHRLTLDLPQKPVWLQADPGRLEQVLVNLLGNAAKYTDRSGDLTVSMQQENAHVLTRVADSGIGIAPDILPHIFDLFVQAEPSLQHSEKGLGVGLALARSLVELHGGSVTAASAGLGQGSEFTVCLPLVAASGAEE